MSDKVLILSKNQKDPNDLALPNWLGVSMDPMQELQVFHKNKKVFHFPLDRSQVVIGRSQQSDLILSGDNISRRHAVISRDDNGFWLEDLSSSGTVANGQKVCKKTQLKLGDVIKIFDWEMRFVEVGDLQDVSERTRKTQIYELTKHLPKEPSPHSIEFGDAGSGVRSFFPLLLIQQVSGKTARIIMKKKTLVLGSAKDCDVVIEDEFVSARHVRVSATDRGFLIEDLDSTNGTWVDRARIQQICLQDSQKMRIGQTEILVSLKSETTQKIQPSHDVEFCGMIGESEPMRLLFSKIEKVSATDMTTLILGETGSGKEMVARAIHDLSARRSAPYVIINCGAISPQLIESELFGHEKGSFTGADKQHKGVFEQAHQGTLFLDEVGELPLDLQSKVLRVIEYKTLRRVGGDAEVRVDVRVIAATHRDLSKRVQEQKFREDLFYRLYVLPLSIPPLRQRKSDIPRLSAAFLRAFAGRSVSLAEDALQKLKNHDWPGNVRELKNTLMRAVAFCDSMILHAGDIEFLQFSQKPVEEKKSPQNDDEKQKILAALEQTNGDKNRAAEILGMGRSTLFRKIKQLEL